MARPSTATSAFGVSKRENHDASGFYSRFTQPELSEDATISPERAIDELFVADARSMRQVPDASVALVVTSPPYFAGKQYEQALGEDGSPGTYLDYLELLREVFRECVRTLEPGGRIAVNVANLGRRPYRSLSSDVIRILQDDLRLLLRGEIVWMKQRGSAGSCAWGSFQRASNPVLRDLSERVIIASKGRFDRALSTRDRSKLDLPVESSMTRDDFMENTVDIWEISPERASRVGHPAPFPVELPARLIQLYSYRGDLILDPFVGAGTTALAAVQNDRHFVGYDLDASYVATANERLAAERIILDSTRDRILGEKAAPLSPLAPAIGEGRSAKDLARRALELAGFNEVDEHRRFPGGVEITFSVSDRLGSPLLVEVAGGFTNNHGGLTRGDTLWRTIAKAALLRELDASPLVVLTTELPAPDSTAMDALKMISGVNKPIAHVIDLLAADAIEILRRLHDGGARPTNRPGA
jgi:site-specific DNA-methyltransferase (adenine-specific)